MRVDVQGLEREARGLLHPEVYDFIAGGSGQERTLRANAKAWRQVRLLPRVLRDVASVDTGIDVLGSPLATPIAVAPTAAHRMVHQDGEVATASGAARAGALYVLSTRSSRRIEDVAAVLAAAGGTWWFQAYVMRDRNLTAGLVRRAATAGASAIVLTGDTPVVGRKRRNRGGGEFIDGSDFMTNIGSLPHPEDAEQAPDLTFGDIGWLGEVSGGLPVIVKGVLRPDDALACASHGAAGVIVSNHGGRQLDGAVPTAGALPGVLAALGTGSAAAGGGCEVYVDGGLRSGGDVLAALAMGARAVFVGRPVLWALAAGGTRGVSDLLTGLTDDLAHAMALSGAAGVADLAGLVAK
ncbi:MAG TPA: alpha-hydroxy acid oxidase [Streptosporangiaceae bacterium]|nr:alpha-hydroxy acid oxidase [Streptosporangiaceae bacterium]